MLDKIEVGKKYAYTRDNEDTRTILAIGKTLALVEDHHGSEYSMSIHAIEHNFEPLPSPESPVVQDDVIWECEDEDKWRFQVHRDGVITWGRPPGYSFIPEEGATWVELLAKAYADLYSRLNPPPTALEEWPKTKLWRAAKEGNQELFESIWKEIEGKMVDGGESK